MRFFSAFLIVIALSLLGTQAQAGLVDEAIADFQPTRILSEGMRAEPHRYWWIKSPLRRAGNQFRVDREERLEVRNRRWAVVEIDRAHNQADVYERVLETWADEGYEEIFSCQGAACGNSQHWANNVFNESVLYGLSRYQHYSTGTVDDSIRVLYAVRRGTQINYVYWLEAERTEPVQAQ